MTQGKSAEHVVEQRIVHNARTSATKNKAEQKGGAVKAPLSRAAVAKRRMLSIFSAHAVEFVKKLGLLGVVFAAANGAAVAAAPQYYEPLYNFVTERLGLHRCYFARTTEPEMRADGQGTLTARRHFLYELYVSDLNAFGLISGRFHGAAQDSLPDDPQWWLVRGYSDGKTAILAYTSEEGVVLGRMVLTATNGGAQWRGTLTGFDPSISKERLVQSPIVVTSNRYQAQHSLDGDPYLEKESLLVDK